MEERGSSSYSGGDQDLNESDPRWKSTEGYEKNLLLTRKGWHLLAYYVCYFKGVESFQVGLPSAVQRWHTVYH